MGGIVDRLWRITGVAVRGRVLVRLGYEGEAVEMGRRIAGAVSAAGLREYYDPYTGEGMGAEHFSWSSLVMEFVEPDPLARSSHVEGSRQRASASSSRAKA